MTHLVTLNSHLKNNTMKIKHILFIGLLLLSCIIDVMFGTNKWNITAWKENICSTLTPHLQPLNVLALYNIVFQLSDKSLFIYMLRPYALGISAGNRNGHRDRSQKTGSPPHCLLSL